MFCPRCGRAVPEGARFCPNCGAAVTLVTVPDAEPATATPTPPDPSGSAAPPAYTAPTPFATPPPGAAPGGVATPAGFGEAMPGAMFAPLPSTTPVYGGFWRRAVAAFLDGVLLNILMSPVYLAWVWPAMLSAERARPEEMDPTQAFSIFGTLMSFVVVAGLVETAYFAFLESSTYQGSLGKLAMGLKVTDLEQRRIALGKAILRRVARTVTGFTLGIGFLMVLWTRRRQTLHDLMVGTLVTRR